MKTSNPCFFFVDDASCESEHFHIMRKKDLTKIYAITSKAPLLTYTYKASFH